MPDLPDLVDAIAAAAGPLGINGVHELPGGKVTLRFSGRHAARTVDLVPAPPISRDPWASVTVWYDGDYGTKVEDRRTIRVEDLDVELVDLLEDLEDHRQRKLA
jgi:hypothetical protein